MGPGREDLGIGVLPSEEVEVALVKCEPEPFCHAMCFLLGALQHDLRHSEGPSRVPVV